MDSGIQYATAADGTSIAYRVKGSGPPLIYMTGTPFTHLQLEQRRKEYRIWSDALSDRFTVVRFDHRGSGLSQRTVEDYSVPAMVSDLEAVLDRTGLDTPAIMGNQASGIIALQFALEHPERASHLVLWDTYPGGRYVSQIPQGRAFLSLLENDWEMFTETVSHAMHGWSSGEVAREYAEFLRESTTQAAAMAVFDALARVDLTPELGQVSQSTIVLHHVKLPFPDTETARLLASRIPDARLVPLHGTWGEPGDDMATVVNSLDELIVGEREAPARQPEPAPSGLVTVLFSDIEGSTELTQRLGDGPAREVFREHERIVRSALQSHGGSEVKTMGDGFMVSFGSATRALECAIAIQRDFQSYTESSGHPLRVRIGLNTGEPIAEADDLFGTAVIAASRIAARARGGEILVANVVRELVAGKGFLFSDMGETVLRGFEDPVRLYQLLWQTER